MSAVATTLRRGLAVLVTAAVGAGFLVGALDVSWPWGLIVAAWGVLLLATARTFARDRLDRDGAPPGGPRPDDLRDIFG